MSNVEQTILNAIRQRNPLNDFPIIDFHGHLAISSDFYYVPYNTPKETVAHMDRIGVDHLVAFTLAISSDPELSNKYTYEACRFFPEKFSALTLLRGDRPEDWLSLIEQGIDNGVKGLKLICAYQGIREETVDWTPAFERIRNQKSVVLNHSWGTPERLRRWADSFPEIVFIIGHADRGYAEIVADLPNVYQCTCAAFVTPAYASVYELWNAMPVDKILFGTDCQDLDFSLSIGSLAYCEEIPEDDKRKILGGNAIRLIQELGWDSPGRICDS